MLRDIKQSLRHLKRQPEQQRPETTRILQQPATSAGSNSVTVGQHAEPNTTRSMAQNPNRRITGSHAKALAEIRSSLKPFETTESGYSSCSESGESINKQFLSQLKALGFDEVCNMETGLIFNTLFFAIRSLYSHVLNVSFYVQQLRCKVFTSIRQRVYNDKFTPFMQAYVVYLCLHKIHKRDFFCFPLRRFFCNHSICNRCRYIYGQLFIVSFKAELLDRIFCPVFLPRRWIIFALYFNIRCLALSQAFQLCAKL